MVSWLWIVPSFIVGFAVGFLVCAEIRRNNCAGTLREDRSDPTEAPYLFLELEPGGLEKIHCNSEVTFRVKLENYLPRK